MARTFEMAVVALAAALLAAAAAAPSLAQPTTTDAPGGGQSASLVPATGAQPTTGDSPGGGSTRIAKPVTGEQVYRQICQACHMADARGGSGAGTIPALAGNAKLNVAAYPITIVVRGKGAMPSLAGMLDEKQVAEVVGYVRTHFGNSYAKPVTEEDVKRLWVAPKDADH